MSEVATSGEVAAGESGANRSGRWRVWLAVVGAVFVVVVLGVELFLRFWVGLGDPPLWVADEAVEYRLVEDQDRRRWGNRILINDLGMRSGAFSRTREFEDEVRVLVIGDSVVNGGTLVDHGALATTVLEERLSERLGRPVSVGNLSAGSWGPVNMAAAFERLGLEGLDVVVLVVSSHDLTDVPTFEALNPRVFPMRSPWSATTEALGRYGPSLLRFYLGIGAEEEELSGLRPRVDLAAAERSRAAVEQVFDLARQAGAAPVLMLHGDIDEARAGRLHAHGRALRAVARDRGVRVVDGMAAFVEASAAGVAVYRDPVHPSDDGQRVYAEVLEGVVVEILGEE
ncbi:SGNH/GDSL hydrolase family protein [Mucisphaera sp.]|uniref:SGNH/GDSL hydrolase family protein n=1 Tax=Mucisphaera sp. TaxID=2913024 RepID=UPI003D0A6A6A